MKESNVGKSFAADTLLIPAVAEATPHLCLLGDEAISLKTYLICPFPGRGLDRRKEIFNYRLSHGRRTVEYAFEILVPWWRVFPAPIHGSLERCENMKKVGVCLNNFFMQDKLYFPSGYADSERMGVHSDDSWRADIGAIGTNRGLAGNFSKSTALNKRDQLEDFFISPRRSVPWQYSIVSRH